MEKGIARDWTPGLEIKFEQAIKGCRSFAERHHCMFIRDTLKYDGRSKEGKRALVQARLRLAIATDDDLKELAELYFFQAEDKPGEIPGLQRASLVSRQLEILKELRTKIREKGIDKEVVGIEASKRR